MDYHMLRYPHVAPGVIYHNPGAPFTPFHQPVFDPTYGPPGHETLLPQGYPVAPPNHGPSTFDQAAFHFGFSTAESHSLGRYGDGTHSPILRAKHDWRIFSSQPWAVSGGIEPADIRGRSILHQWLDRLGPQLYVCKVPLEGRLCGTTHNRQDRALTHIRKHLNAKPYECGGRCDNPACQETFGAPSYLRAHMNPVLRLCRFCGHEFLRQNVKRHEDNCRRRP